MLSLNKNKFQRGNLILHFQAQRGKKKEKSEKIQSSARNKKYLRQLIKYGDETHEKKSKINNNDHPMQKKKKKKKKKENK